MQCPKCQTQARPGAHFCSGCGYDLSKIVQSPPPPGPSVTPALPMQSQPQPQAGVPPYSPPPQQPPPGYGAPSPAVQAPSAARKGPSIRQILPWLLVCLVVLAVGLGIGSILGNKSAGKAGTETPTATPAPTGTPVAASPTDTSSPTETPAVAPTMTSPPPPKDTATPLVPSGTEVGQSASDFTLTDLNGTPLTLSNFRDKVVVLTFWDTWNPDSLKMLGHLKTLHETHSGEPNLAILAVNSEGWPECLEDLVSSKGILFSILLDTDGTQTKAYQIVSFPTTLLIDKTGTIRHKRPGTVLSKEDLEDLIEPLLNE